jgi:hypothetical protein
METLTAIIDRDLAATITFSDLVDWADVTLPHTVASGSETFLKRVLRSTLEQSDDNLLYLNSDALLAAIWPTVTSHMDDALAIFHELQLWDWNTPYAWDLELSRLPRDMPHRYLAQVALDVVREIRVHITVTPSVMIPRVSRFGGLFNAICPHCSRLCAFWDEGDLDVNGNLLCFHGSTI